MTPRLGIADDVFFRDYGEALAHGSASVFAGAGLSRASGYVNWRELLEDYAKELDLDLDLETDLVSVAQYHLNAEGGQRARLNQKIVDAFKRPADLTPAHAVLARLPITVYWTTNYDDLLERALTAAGKRPDVKSAASSLTTTDRQSDAVVHKLHGDLADTGNIVITRDDYEEYVDKHRGFRERLQSDLSALTFLFLGYSFTDPHLDFILGELRRAHRNSARTHYAVMRRESRQDHASDARYAYAANRQRLRIDDLKRYGIQTVVVDEYKDVADLLDRLRLRYLRRQVFVSGAASEFEPMGREWLDQFTYELGKALIEQDYNVVTGLGMGIGNGVILGGLSVLYGAHERRIDKRMLLRPFPLPRREGEDLSSIHTEIRRDMLQTVGFAVVIAGNRHRDHDPRKPLELSPGVREEVEIARENGVYVLPVGATGSFAEKLWAEIDADSDAHFPTTHPPQAAWETLNDTDAKPGDMVAALMEIMDALRPS